MAVAVAQAPSGERADVDAFGGDGPLDGDGADPGRSGRDRWVRLREVVSDRAP